MRKAPGFPKRDARGLPALSVRGRGRRTRAMIPLPRVPSARPGRGCAGPFRGGVVGDDGTLRATLAGARGRDEKASRTVLPPHVPLIPEVPDPAPGRTVALPSAGPSVASRCWVVVGNLRATPWASDRQGLPPRHPASQMTVSGHAPWRSRDPRPARAASRLGAVPSRFRPAVPWPASFRSAWPWPTAAPGPAPAPGRSAPGSARCRGSSWLAPFACGQFGHMFRRVSLGAGEDRRAQPGEHAERAHGRGRRGFAQASRAPDRGDGDDAGQADREQEPGCYACGAHADAPVRLPAKACPP